MKIKGKTKRPAPVRISSTHDLAAYLGLSTWTVSRAINNHPEVNVRTRERVHQAMRELGFQPNPFARGLNKKGTGLIGVCFSGLNSSVMIDKLKKLEEFLREHHYRPVLAVASTDLESELGAIQDFRNINVEGVVLVQSALTSEQAKQALEGIPYVLVDPQRSSHTGTVVTVDRYKAMHFLVDHLHDLGHRNFALLGIDTKDSWRGKGLLDAAKKHKLGVDVYKTFIMEPHLNHGVKEGVLLARQFLEEKKKPTAMICINDRVALGAMQELRNNGFKIPDDFSITGFDNLDIAHEMSPTITTIDQQSKMLSEVVGQLMLDKLGVVKLDPKKLSTKITPLLVTGESTGKAPASSRSN